MRLRRKEDRKGDWKEVLLTRGRRREESDAEEPFLDGHWPCPHER